MNLSIQPAHVPDVSTRALVAASKGISLTLQVFYLTLLSRLYVFEYAARPRSVQTAASAPAPPPLAFTKYCFTF